MIYLTTTSDLLRVVTDVAATVDVHASWIDQTATTSTPGRTNTLISTATTTTVVGSPGVSTYRTVKTLLIRNRSSLAVVVAVVHSDGSLIPELIRVQLAPGDVMSYDEHNGWSTVDQLYGRELATSEDVAGSQTVGQMRVVVLDRDVVNDCATADQMKSITGLAFPVQAGGHRYWFRAVIMYTASLAATGSRWSIFGESVQTTLIYKWEASLTTTTKTTGEGFTGYDSPSAANGSSASTGSNIAIVEGFVDTTRQDSFIGIRSGSETAGSAITAKAGSLIQWQRVS